MFGIQCFLSLAFAALQLLAFPKSFLNQAHKPLSFINFGQTFLRKTAILSLVLMHSSVRSAISSDVDELYPGTAVQRMLAIRDRVRQLSVDNSKLNGDWEQVRRNILWAGGLRDLPNAQPGAGYTGHSFNDFNHCDLTAMVYLPQKQFSIYLSQEIYCNSLASIQLRRIKAE